MNGDDKSCPTGNSVRREPIGLIGFEFWSNVVRDYLVGTRYEAHYVSGALDTARGPIARWRMLRQPPWCDIRIIHSLNALSGLRSLVAFRAQGCQLVLHWIGADFRRLRDHSGGAQGVVRALLAALRPTHLIDSPELAADLEKMGIHGEIVRLVPKAVNADLMPLPSRPAAMAYWADGRADFYGRPIIYALARRWPDMPFRIVGPSGRDPSAPANVEFLGFQKDLGPVYAQTSVLVRVLEHDSISAMVLEALARGRDVIYSREFPGTRHATNEASAVTAMSQHIATYGVNSAGASYVRSEFSPSRWAETLVRAYDGVLMRRGA